MGDNSAMAFQLEAPYTHGQAAKTAILWCNLGTPDAPTAPALRRYLGEFLADRRVVEIPKIIWMLILHGIILRIRPKKSAAKYASIWTSDGSPLKVGTQAQARALEVVLREQGHDIAVHMVMRYGQPNMASVMNQLKLLGVTRVLLMTAYPQYSGTTTASVFDAFYKWALNVRWVPELRFVNQYHDHPAYIAALAGKVKAHWAAHGQAEQLVMSFHGVPERTLHLGDPYHCQCHKTARLLAEHLGLTKEQYKVTFQSRFGKAKWLEPYTEPTLMAMASGGVKSVDVMCPGFTSDCLETLEEINDEAREAFMHAGGEHFSYIACLNDDAHWIEGLAHIASDHLQGWPTNVAHDTAASQATHQAARDMGAKQ
jgi:protoporphyrin/coproporphyrin ferrochelatase